MPRHADTIQCHSSGESGGQEPRPDSEPARGDTIWPGRFQLFPGPTWRAGRSSSLMMLSRPGRQPVDADRSCRQPEPGRCGYFRSVVGKKCAGSGCRCVKKVYSFLPAASERTRGAVQAAKGSKSLCILLFCNKIQDDKKSGQALSGTVYAIDIYVLPLSCEAGNGRCPTRSLFVFGLPVRYLVCTRAGNFCRRFPYDWKQDAGRDQRTDSP